MLKISAKTGLGVHKLLPGPRRRPSTPTTAGCRPASSTGCWPRPRPHHASPAGRILYATQGTTDPPTFTLFATKALPAPYLRYLERRLREHFEFGPTPLKFRVRRRSADGSASEPGTGATDSGVEMSVPGYRVVMFAQPWLAAVALGCAIAAALWGRAAARLSRAARRIEAETANSPTGPDAVDLARAAFDKDLARHHPVLGPDRRPAGGVAVQHVWFELPLLAVGVPVVMTMRYAPRFLTRPAWPRTGPSSSGGPRRSWPRTSWPPGAGPPAWPPRTCPISRASSSDGCTSPAPG